MENINQIRKIRKKGLKTKISTHLEIDEKNGIFCTTGSLGHGLPIATGIAFSKKIVSAFDEAEASGLASIQVDGYFVDYPIVDQARRTLAMMKKIDEK